MTDPLSLIALGAAIGGASGKLVESTWTLAEKWIAEYFKNHRDTALRQAEQNGARFLVSLAQRLNELEEQILLQHDSTERIAEALSDPDVAAILHQSLLAAARSGSESKHDVLARAVAERVAAQPDSTHALAANIAVDAIPGLSSHHLKLLALIAIVYSIRSPGLPLSEEPPADTEQWDTTLGEREGLSSYLPWLENALARTLPSGQVATSDYVHLASTNCLVVEQGLERDLRAVLQPFRERRMTMAASGHFHQHLAAWLYSSENARALREFWKKGLQRVDLTPAGLLIGMAAFDQLSGEKTALNWSSSYITSPAEAVNLHVWDGRRIREEFLDALDAAVIDRMERGVQPWYNIQMRR